MRNTTEGGRNHEEHEGHKVGKRQKARDRRCAAVPDTDETQILEGKRSWIEKAFDVVR